MNTRAPQNIKWPMQNKLVRNTPQSLSCLRQALGACDMKKFLQYKLGWTVRTEHYVQRMWPIGSLVMLSGKSIWHVQGCGCHRQTDRDTYYQLLYFNKYEDTYVYVYKQQYCPLQIFSYSLFLLFNWFDIWDEYILMFKSEMYLLIPKAFTLTLSIFFWDMISPCRQRWPPTRDAPASNSWRLAGRHAHHSWPQFSFYL